MIKSLSAQILHDNSCSSISTNFTLDWDATPSGNQFNWTPQGNTTFTASNIQGTGNQIDFAITGATGTLTTENSVSTPGITNSLSGGTDALHISSSGLGASQEIRLTMTFTPALAGDISFDLYNIIELSGGGAGGQQMEIFGLTTTGFAIVPELTDNGSPSWELEGPGVIDGNATSTAGTNDQVGVNFRSISDISTITIILRRCSGCGNAANTEFALGDIDICLTPDTDQDGIPDTQDQDDDNDGILDVIEKCPTQDRSLADWDNYTYNNGDASNTYNLPDGTNMTVAISSNGASIVAGETNSDLTGGQGAGTVGLFLNGNQNLQVNSIDVTFSFDQAIDSLEYTIFDVDQLGGQYVDSITIIGFFDGFVVFPNMTASANNTVTQNRAVGDVSTADNLATANLDVSFTEPIDSMVVFYGNGSTAPPAPGNQWITIWDFSYIGDCGSVDSDGDGVADYLDIDADNDGIVDYIEWQASTGTPIAPAGADADSDGIDDNFEVVSAPVDTDGDGIPDFQDPDADNDGDLDILEGWDTNNDGVADTSPSGSDTDGDGLDDNFDNQAGFNSTTNITNNGQTSDDFPNLDETLTAERDWREDPDIDDDGVPDYDDIDDDNDGILDVNEGKGSNNPSGDEDGDGIQNWADTNDGGNGGDGSVTDYTDGNGDGIPDVYDADNDGIPNHHDPDSDGDGIADIIEAGGVDANGDGIVDGVFADTDGDGWSNTFDSDNGGTALTDVDIDGDGLQNHLDIDADDDGIVDVIESQPSGALVGPSGSDSDNDGIDDNFDTDEGNSLTTPENTDLTDNPDYLDTNSDNDVDSDLIEGWDTNNDGSANTTPAGTDSDNDGLDDNFDNIAGQNSTTNVTNGGQTSASFPDLDTPGGELDWRSINNTNDNDGDGVTNDLDIDDDNDGILDVDEGCVSIVADYSGSVTSQTGVGNSGNVTGTPDGDFAEWHTNGDIMVIDFATTYPAGTRYVITWRERIGETGTAEPIIEESTDNAAYTTLGASITTNSTTAVSDTITSENDFRYLRISKDDPPSITDFQIDAVGIVSPPSIVVNATSVGVGSYTVPSTGQLFITINGGDGGGAAQAGGSGATIDAVFDVVANDEVRFVVGEGSDGSAGNSAGGAGSTGLFINNTLVMVAGGGAGGDNSGGGQGLGATATTTAGSGNGAGAGAGGAGGAGGGGHTGASGGGGGINSDGGDGDGLGGEAADLVPADGVTLALGGAGDGASTDGGDGFTGGGGAADGSWSGGGGGYSGGGAAGDGGGAGGGASFLDTGDPNFVSGSITAGVDGGGGAAGGANGDDGFVTISFSATSGSCTQDTDGDGVIDAFDPDSDGDGIADIIEAGGVDTDGNGIVDGAFTDTDGDGWSNVFDSDNGGSALTDGDQDGDGFQNRIDIDSDDDGIIDIIESQPSGTLISPTGNDSDGDGIDDAFDPNSGNTLTDPENTDGADNPDYLDTDTDNDGDSDLIEGWDTNNDGVADTTPLGTDSDGDGLDDNFDDVVGPNNTTNVTNNGQSSASFPNLDLVGTSELDWREDKDFDDDGIPDNVDIDDDNDGILDVDECQGSVIFEGGFEGIGGLSLNVNNLGVSIAPWILTSGGTNVIAVDGPGGGSYGIGGPEVDARGGAGNYFDINGTGQIYQTFTLSGTSQLLFEGYFSARDGDTGDGEISILAGTGVGGAVQATSGVITTGDNTAWTYTSDTVTLAAGTYSYVVDMSNPINFDEGGISIICDTDNDNIPDVFDLDSDGDGIPDIIEAGGVDVDGNGIADDETDTDGDGWADIFDPSNGGTELTDPDTDGDGLENRIDIDADDDGIVDIIESQASGVLISPSGNDSDDDGIDDSFDPDNGNALTVPVDTENDGTPDYIDTNSDNDGQSDAIEGWDTDNDGTADTTPTGSDSDNDGLDDAYDDVVGLNNTTNITNGGQSSGSFPNLDVGNTSERDWREILDTDGDGIADEFDIDDDNDGIPDYDEVNCSPSAAATLGGGASGSAALVTDGDRTENNGVTLNASGEHVIINLGASLPIGSKVALTLWKNNTGDKTLRVAQLPSATADLGGGTNPLIIDQSEIVLGAFVTQIEYSLTVPTQFIQVEMTARTSGRIELIEVQALSGCTDEDTDGDGIPNSLDLDADDDGIADIIEAGGVDNDGDGRADNDTDTDSDGYADLFDADNGGTALPVEDSDGDGIENYLDIDSDSDGILDNLEGQTTAGFRPSDNTDIDGDGWDDEYDGDVTGGSNGTPITLSNNDGVGEFDYLDFDSDGDGLPDWIEGFDDDNSEDALDDLLLRGDNYELAEGNPLKYVNTDDADADGIPDWLEDDNGDNIPNVADATSSFFFDTDNDGLIDLYDPDNGGVPSNVPDGDGDGEYDFRDTDNQISLPVELIGFKAIAEGKRSKLVWVTESELNNDYFLIERSGDDQEFAPIAQVDGAGNSNTRIDYFIYDETPLKGNNYYRLKQVDFNGESSYSQIEVLNYKSEGMDAILYPNPTSGEQLFLTINEPKAAKYTLRVVSSEGKVILTRELSFEAETLFFELELLGRVNLSSGTYFVLLQSLDDLKTLPFVVR